MPFNGIQSLHLEIKDTPTIDISLGGKVIVISGNSGTGKSFICNLIKSMKELPCDLISSSIPLDKIEIWGQDRDVNTDTKDKLIILDRYPVYKYTDVLTDMIKNSDNKFIIMTHAGPESIPLSRFKTYRLVRSSDGKHIKTEDAGRFTPVDQMWRR
jgi:hypothetical protein